MRTLTRLGRLGGCSVPYPFKASKAFRLHAKIFTYRRATKNLFSAGFTLGHVPRLVTISPACKKWRCQRKDCPKYKSGAKGFDTQDQLPKLVIHAARSLNRPRRTGLTLTAKAFMRALVCCLRVATATCVAVIGALWLPAKCRAAAIASTICPR